MRVPFGPEVGAAAFRNGGDGVIVFDQRRPIDLSPARDDPVFAAARVELLQDAVLIRVPLPAAAALRLGRRRDSWEITIGAPTPGAAVPIRAEQAGDDLRLLADSSAVVAVPSRDTGGTFLVGTQHKPGQAVTLARRTPEFTLLATFQGVVVDPVTDSLTMRPIPEGFVLSAQSRPLSMASQEETAAAEADAVGFSRRFDWRALAPVTLQRRLERAVAAAAAAPAQGRLRERINAAQAMLALGLGAEAQALLSVTVAEAPGALNDPDVIALSAVAALLAGRIDEARGIDDARLTGSDEIALWRAVEAAARDPAAPGAATVFAAQVPLIRAYPAPLRDRLMPIAMQTMALGGQAAAVTRLLPAEQTAPGLELARAIAMDLGGRPGGEPAPALASYDKLAASADRFVSARATARAIELRLAAGEITTTQAADALERNVFAWRGDAWEPALRLRIAELRRQSGAWRAAIGELRELDEGWPERRETTKALMSGVFADALAQDARDPLPPLDFVTLIEDNPDLLPAGGTAPELAAHLADRLVALDLPKRAAPALDRIANAAPPGAARAEIGERIAQLYLRQDDAAGALAALERSDAAVLPQPLRERRGLTWARAAAANGERDKAFALLAEIGTPAADDARAGLLEAAKDWQAALAVLKPYVAQEVPSTGMLSDADARTMLRLASVAAQVEDEPTLARLRDHDLPRMPAGPLSDLMTMLTGRPVRSVTDLPVVAREAALVRTLPGSLGTLTGAGRASTSPR